MLYHLDKVTLQTLMELVPCGLIWDISSIYFIDIMVIGKICHEDPSNLKILFI